jgi:hypothetical protein
MRGITIGAWGPAAYEPHPTRRALQTLKRRQHVDTVTLIVVWAQHDANSTKVEPGGITVPTRNLVAAIRAARRLHMRVVLRPYVDPEDGSWRGAITPRSTGAWFKSYNRFILRYARLAQRTHVDGFVVGSELSTLSGKDARWRSLVGAVRKRFRGFVAYQANWGLEADHVRWWDAVDAISISAYYELTDELDPSVGNLVAGWSHSANGIAADWVRDITSIHGRWGRKVMFGEIGYRPAADTAAHPWALASPAGVPHSPGAQQRAYEAALRVWYRVPWFAGFQWWYAPAGGSPAASVSGGGHQPLAPALQTIGRWYAHRP